jgi:Phage integrase family
MQAWTDPMSAASNDGKKTRPSMSWIGLPRHSPSPFRSSSWNLPKDQRHCAVVKDAGLGPDVTPHVLRHTAATWLMQAGTDPWEAAGFLGMTVETLIGRYGHHHPDYLSAARGAFSRHRNRHRNAATDREQTETNVTKIADFSKAGG